MALQNRALQRFLLCKTQLLLLFGRTSWHIVHRLSWHVIDVAAFHIKKLQKPVKLLYTLWYGVPTAIFSSIPATAFGLPHQLEGCHPTQDRLS